MARQRTFFHKCHRCIYRGQAASWEPAEAPIAMLPASADAAAHAAGNDVLVVEIAPPPAKKRPSKTDGAKSDRAKTDGAKAEGKKVAKLAKVVEAST